MALSCPPARSHRTRPHSIRGAGPAGRPAGGRLPVRTEDRILNPTVPIEGDKDIEDHVTQWQEFITIKQKGRSQTARCHLEPNARQSESAQRLQSDDSDARAARR